MIVVTLLFYEMFKELSCYIVRRYHRREANQVKVVIAYCKRIPVTTVRDCILWYDLAIGVRERPWAILLSLRRKV